MKRFYYLFFMAVITACAFTSCGPTVTKFDDKLLFSSGGKWETPSASKPETHKLYYIYYENGKGKTWDEGDDVSESDLVQDGNGWFTWEVDNADMVHIYFMDNNGASVPQAYTLTLLTESKLEYKTASGKKYSFTKVKK